MHSIWLSPLFSCLCFSKKILFQCAAFTDGVVYPPAVLMRSGDVCLFICFAYSHFDFSLIYLASFVRHCDNKRFLFLLLGVLCVSIIFFFSRICLSEFRWGYFSLIFKHGISNLFLKFIFYFWNYLSLREISLFSLFFVFLLTLRFFYLLLSDTLVINKILQFSTRIFVLLLSCFQNSFLCCSFINDFLLWQSTKTLFDSCYLYNSLFCFAFQTFFHDV